MKTIIKYWGLLLLSLAFMIIGCKEDEIGTTADCTTNLPSPDTHPKAVAFQNVLNKYTKQGLPGISLLVRDENGTWYGSAGLADINENIKMQPCHVSKVASVTKLFMGALVMKLVEEDKIALDAPVTTYLTRDYSDKVANINKVTLRQLLNHTSGIPDLIEQNGFYLAVLNNPAKEWHPSELLKYIYELNPLFEPGSQLEYSNTNLLLAIMAIEGATGQDHAKLLREKIIQPLGLQNTYYYWHDPLPKFVAQGYYDLYNNGTIVNMTNFSTGSGNGYTGIYSSVFDLQRFIEALLRDKTLLQPASLQEMIRITAEDLIDQEGYGVSIRKDFYDRPANEYALGHRGRDLAYTADLFYFPNQDITMALLINYGTDADSDLKPVFQAFRKEIVYVIME
ncbi:MAG: serine hydrolase domain-containing protein [Saprospiraceae bacterium]